MRAIRYFPWLLCGLLVACSPPSKITLEAKKVASGVEVSGTTSLPDGAQFLVALRKDLSSEPICLALPLVKGHRYRATLKPPVLAPGRYQIRLEFSPKAFSWSNDVLPAVGKNGEKLAGPLVRDSGQGYRILEVLAPLDLP